MFRRLALAAAATGLLAGGVGLGACTPISSYSGFQAIDQRPADVKIGEDTKSTVMAELGSPSVTSTFDPDTWYYISQLTDRVAFYKARVSRREVVAIKFDNASEKVAEVNTYKLEDGKVIAFNGRETATRGRELTIIEQLLGNVGSGVLPQTDYDPGQRR